MKQAFTVKTQNYAYPEDGMSLATLEGLIDQAGLERGLTDAILGRVVVLQKVGRFCLDESEPYNLSFK